VPPSATYLEKLVTMSLKRSASEAAMGSPKKADSDDDIDAKKKVLLLTDLPIEALSRITMSSFDINSSEDIDTIIQLANQSRALFHAFRLWLCAGCNGVAIFDTTEEEGVLVPRTDSGELCEVMLPVRIFLQ
jgi:hypothetical protein